MSWLAAGVASAGVTLAAVKWVSGNSKEKKAKKARAALKAPFYDVQNEYYQNANSAASMAQGGLPTASKDFYTNKSQQGLSSGITAINANGGNPNDIAKIFQGYDDGIGKIATVDAETHLNNIKYYHQVNKDLAGQKTIQWAINKQQPYLNTLKELSAAQKAGEATKNEAYGDALSAVSSFGTSMAGGKGFGGGGGGKTSGGSIPQLNTSGTSIGQYSSEIPQRTVGTDVPQIAQVSDPFSNTQNDYAEFQQYLDFKNNRR